MLCYPSSSKLQYSSCNMKIKSVVHPTRVDCSNVFVIIIMLEELLNYFIVRNISSCDLFDFFVCLFFRLPRWPTMPNVRYFVTSCLQCLQCSS